MELKSSVESWGTELHGLVLILCVCLSVRVEDDYQCIQIIVALNCHWGAAETSCEHKLIW